MRFVDTDGTMLDLYQANTNMTDESGQAYPTTANSLFEQRDGPERLLRLLRHEHAHRLLNRDPGVTP